ncbi:hypothetical protein [Actinoplanes sp. N902-109]|uniref:hypothetical protein n=1 Tax=Actinoplanes sp. (strain N902-109) TaxID=649831 RepID=UPI000329610E|nr:hypothetical protein [Actinoplanes sp. N902-109]AGL19493.1 hypothetical protein L083_5983 [Actinoplanes sp. N902-109]
MSFTTDLLGTVEEAVQRLLPSLRGQDTIGGRLTYRDPSGLAGLAAVDGSEQPVPVKVSGATDAREGDRVSLIRTGGYWTVVGVLSMGGMGEASTRGAASGSDTKSDAAYEDLPVVAVTAFRKLHAATAVRVAVQVSMYSTAATTKAMLGVRITGTVATDGSAYDSGDVDVLPTAYLFNAANDHRPVAGAIRHVGMPPGDYSVQIRWKRISGSGTLTVDTNDGFLVEVDEIRRQG